MADHAAQGHYPSQREALESLTAAVVENIPSVNFASISVRKGNEPLRTVAATDPLALKLDKIQYELGEGPCYAAVTDDRFVLINDMSRADEFPRYAPRAHHHKIGAQAAIQLFSNGQRAGLNLYSENTGVFNESTSHVADLYATQVAALLGYANQVEQLTEALHTRTDIGTAVGILMERFKIDQHRAFSYLIRNSQTQNVKVRTLAQQIIQKAPDKS